MPSPTSFVHLDPFVAAAVGETTIWGESDAHFRDVASVHRDGFELLQRDIEAVRRDPLHLTRARFVIGSAGSGKSHLFSRLRRQTGAEAAFTFVVNPPTQADSIIPTILERVIHGLRRPVIRDGETMPFSQLRESLFALLHTEGMFERTSDEANDYWESLLLPDKRGFLHEVLNYLVVKRHYDEDLLGVMLLVLDDELERVALRWLSGSSNLSDEELSSIGQRNPLDDEGCYKLLQRLGTVTAASGRPIILVLDQLDEMTGQEHITQFERLLTGLIDGSQNWLILISLIQNRFGLWLESMSQATKSRLATGADESMPIIELMPVNNPEQKKEILRSRLGTPGLLAARTEQGIADSLFPLTAVDVERLASGEPVYPRKLLRMARDVYHSRCEATAAETPSLADTVEALFLDARAEIGDLPEPNTSALADRVREAISAACEARDLAVPEVRAGQSRGVDHEYVVEERRLRIFGHNKSAGKSLEDFLNKAIAEGGPALLIRDGRVPVRGDAARGRLTEFEKNGEFLHLTDDENRNLFALGKVMAELREGGLNDLDCDPPASPENIRKVLGALPAIARNRVVVAALKTLHPRGERLRTRRLLSPVIGPAFPVARPDSTSNPENGDGPPKLPLASPRVPISAPVPAGLVDTIAEILRNDHWLALERLQHRLQEQTGRPVTLAQLRAALSEPQLAQHLTCYPEDLSRKTDVHILIWNEPA